MIYVNLTLPRIDEVNMIKKVNYIFGTEEFNMIYYGHMQTIPDPGEKSLVFMNHNLNIS